MRAARHLVDDVGVPAILGFRSGKEVMDVAGSLLIPREVLTVASLTSTPQITRLPQPAALPRMVWRTTFSFDRVAEVTAILVESVLAPRAKRGKVRVTLVRPEGTGGLLSFAETFYRRLHFNGKSAVENEDAYQEITFPAGDLTKEALAALVERVVATAPTFLVVTGATSILPLVEEVEAHSRAGAPTYIVPLQSMSAFASFIGRDADRRHRVFGVGSTSNSMANARFVIRYNEARGEHVGREINPASCYDAFYLLAYATFALGAEPITGPSLARAFGRLVPPGSSVEVGPTHVYEALGTLSNGGHIDLQGASTALDFDLSTGEGPSDFVLLCSGVTADGWASGEDVESGVTIGSQSARPEGSMRCP